MTRLFRLAAVTATATLLLILLGGVARAATGGEGCGGHWPMCRGAWLPPLEPLAIVEYLHRAVAASVGVLVLATVVAAALAHGASGRTRAIAWASLGVIAAQGLLGAAGVWLRWPAWTGISHLAAALLVFALTLATAIAVALDRGAPRWLVAAAELPAVPRRDLRRLAQLGAVATLGLTLSGAASGATAVAVACTSWPLCVDGGRATPATVAASGLGSGMAVAVVALLAALVALVAWGRPAPAPVRLLAAGAVGLAAGESVLRLAAEGGATWPGPASLATLTLLWASLVAIAVLARGAMVPAVAIQALAPGGGGAVGLGIGPSAVVDPTAVLAAWWRRAGQTVRDYVALTKPGILSLLLTTTLCAMLIAAAGLPPFGLVLATMVGGILAAGGANVLNCFIDRDIDAQMPRTRHRATVAGRIGPAAALGFGLGLSVAAVVELGLAVNWTAALLALAGNLFYVLVYTRWLKRTTPQNIVIGGAAGAVPPLVGWAAVAGGLSPLAWGLFAVVFFWTPPHFWALALLKQGEYGRAAVPMLPNVAGERETRRQIVLYSTLLAAVCLLLVPFGLGPIYLAGALALNALFLGLAIRLWQAPSKRLARRLFFYSLWYLALLFAAAVADRLVLG